MEKKIEIVINILNKYFLGKDLKKPTLFHSIKVGLFLYDMGYSEDIVFGGFLHDILEDTEISDMEIIELFGINVLDLVKANTKNSDISKEFVNEELISRCSLYSEEALIIKSADILCNFEYYKKIVNISEIERCKKLASMVSQFKKPEYNDKIFDDLLKLI